MSTKRSKEYDAIKTLERADRIALRVDKRFILFDTPEECADAAAPVFQAERWRWRWTECGIPDWAEILRALISLATIAESAKETYCESGRLVYYRGQYGHERPSQKVLKGVSEAQQ